MKKRIFITGGHLTPALALIAQLDKSVWEIFYVGRKNSLEGEKSLSMEYSALKNRNDLKFLTITTGRLQRRFSLQTIPSLLKIPIGFFQSLIWMIKYQPVAVLSFGGYVGVPVAIVARILGVPVIIHEQTIVPSLSSKIISPLASKILVSWPSMVENYSKQKSVLTGNPIRKEIYQVNDTQEYKKFLKVKKQNNLPVLYITGGSQGSHSINGVVSDALPKLLEKYILIHQCGSSQKYDDYEILESQMNKLPQTLRDRYFLQKFIGPNDIGWVLKVSDIVIGRSGANTVFEIAALGKVSILIPLPWSGGGEQQKNAQVLEKFGGSIILNQENFTTESLIKTLLKIEQGKVQFELNAQKAKQLAIVDAAQNIASELEKIVN